MRLVSWKLFVTPFRICRFKWYFGRIKLGTPYFLPRSMRRLTHQEILEAVKIAQSDMRLVKRSYQDWYNLYQCYQKSVPKRLGFDFVDLGWKTKFSDTDYHIEWSPMISFVFWKWQLAITFVEDDLYWKAWLYYSRNTDTRLSDFMRIQELRTKFPLKLGECDYYTKCLKTKYL